MTIEISTLITRFYGVATGLLFTYLINFAGAIYLSKYGGFEVFAKFQNIFNIANFFVLVIAVPIQIFWFSRLADHLDKVRGFCHSISKFFLVFIFVCCCYLVGTFFINSWYSYSFLVIISIIGLCINFQILSFFDYFNKVFSRNLILMIVELGRYGVPISVLMFGISFGEVLLIWAVLGLLAAVLISGLIFKINPYYLSIQNNNKRSEVIIKSDLFFKSIIIQILIYAIHSSDRWFYIMNFDLVEIGYYSLIYQFCFLPLFSLSVLFQAFTVGFETRRVSLYQIKLGYLIPGLVVAISFALSVGFFSKLLNLDGFLFEFADGYDWTWYTMALKGLGVAMLNCICWEAMRTGNVKFICFVLVCFLAFVGFLNFGAASWLRMSSLMNANNLLCFIFSMVCVVISFQRMRVKKNPKCVV